MTVIHEADHTGTSITDFGAFYTPTQVYAYVSTLGPQARSPDSTDRVIGAGWWQLGWYFDVFALDMWADSHFFNFMTQNWEHVEPDFHDSWRLLRIHCSPGTTVHFRIEA